MSLTPRQLDILKQILNCHATNGYSPTMQELANTLKVSRVTVWHHVQALVEKGFLQHTPGWARSTTPTDTALEFFRR